MQVRTERHERGGDEREQPVAHPAAAPHHRQGKAEERHRAEIEDRPEADRRRLHPGRGGEAGGVARPEVELHRRRPHGRMRARHEREHPEPEAGEQPERERPGAEGGVEPEHPRCGLAGPVSADVTSHSARPRSPLLSPL